LRASAASDNTSIVTSRLTCSKRRASSCETKGKVNNRARLMCSPRSNSTSSPFRRRPKGEAGVRQAPGLHDFGLGDAEVLESCLQTAVVEQGHLNGIVDAQRLCEQLAHAAIDGVGIGIAARPAHVLAELLLGRRLDRREPRIGREAGTASQHGGSQDDQEQARTSNARAVGRDAPEVGR
jgi:hypothetical protein